MTNDQEDKLFALAVRVANLNSYNPSKGEINSIMWEARVLVREIRSDTQTTKIRREVGGQ
jgi:hypothetical protein